MNWSKGLGPCGVLIGDVYWTWTADKAQDNLSKHHLSFELAVHVFNDPLALSQLDEFPFEERFRTLGMLGNVHIIVVHTDPVEIDEVKTGRIISARKAEPAERRAYEDGDW
jgi:uncharacterized DUF497 family protein